VAALIGWAHRMRRRDLRTATKAVAPPQVVALVRARREVWADARLRLLASVGGIPSHSVRNFWYGRAGLRVDPSSSIHWRAEFYCPEGITLGRNCIIGDNAFLDGRDTITFGDNVNVGSHVSIYTREHDVQDPMFAETGGPVVIADYAWLASHCVILPGVRIGRGAVVAAGSVVTKDVPDHAIVGGVPARVIGARNPDLIYELRYRKRFV